LLSTPCSREYRRVLLNFYSFFFVQEKNSRPAQSGPVQPDNPVQQQPLSLLGLVQHSFSWREKSAPDIAWLVKLAPVSAALPGSASASVRGLPGGLVV